VNIELLICSTILRSNQSEKQANQLKAEMSQLKAGKSQLTVLRFFEFRNQKPEIEEIKNGDTRKNGGRKPM